MPGEKLLWSAGWDPRTSSQRYTRTWGSTRGRNSSITPAARSPFCRAESRFRNFGRARAAPVPRVIRNMKIFRIALLLLAVPLSPVFGSSQAWGQDSPLPWSKMEKFFAPPEEYKGKLGDYRSLMKFDDGTPVKTPQDWTR